MKKALITIFFLTFWTLVNGQNYKQYPLFIYSFTRYIQWPETDNHGDFEILVVGDSPLLDELKVLAQNKKVGERPIKIVKINGVAEIRKCSMIFLPNERSGELPEVLKRVKDQSILVMTEQAGLGMQGSCINFITKEGKLAFELNQSALIKQNLKASTELTRLATII
ncbi:MAG: YfiR family protein [Cyclobacteriaceae bacterium]